MRTVAIVQARMGSERLPGKALLRIGDKTILERVIERTRMIEGADKIVVATTNEPEDAPIFSTRTVDTFGGPTEDVLDRYYRAADRFQATHVLRVTADCPLLDPTLNARILDKLVNSDADYVSISTRSVGLVQEAFTAGALEQAWESTLDPYDREHVVPWMIRNLKCKFLKPPFELGNGRWCVDTQADLDKLRDLHQRYPSLFVLAAEQLVSL